MMNILVCNDDGYLAEGIAVLARVAGEFANVRVVAPERNRSGVSNSLTLDRPLHIRQAENGFYYVSGTPTDCIHLGLHALPDFKPDLVLSGVNHGANMGDDTIYSGTVGAAMEGYLFGVPAIAFSQVAKGWAHIEAAAEAAKNLVLQLQPQVLTYKQEGAAPAWLLNVNIPNLPVSFSDKTSRSLPHFPYTGQYVPSDSAATDLSHP